MQKRRRKKLERKRRKLGERTGWVNAQPDE
jgi:hypothetical protein